MKKIKLNIQLFAEKQKERKSFGELLAQGFIVFSNISYATVKLFLLSVPLLLGIKFSDGIVEHEIVSAVALLFLSVPEIIQTIRGKKTTLDKFYTETIKEEERLLKSLKREREINESYKRRRKEEKELQKQQVERPKPIINNAKGDFRHDLYTFDNNDIEEQSQSDDKSKKLKL